MTGACGAGRAGDCVFVAGMAGAEWISANGFVVVGKLLASGFVRMMPASFGAKGGSDAVLGAFVAGGDLDIMWYSQPPDCESSGAFTGCTGLLTTGCGAGVVAAGL